jgi:Skp family chaperone for outer membrane proteins
MSIASIVMKSFPLAVAVSGRALSAVAVVLVVPLATVVAVGAAVMGAASSLSAQTPAAASAVKQSGMQDQKVAVIDIAKAIDQYKVYIDLRTGLSKRVEDFQKQLKANAEQIEQLRVTITQIDEGLPQRAEAEHQYKMELQNQDFRRKYFNDLLAADEVRMMLRVYEDLDFALAKVAKRQGIGVVLPKREMPANPMPIADMRPREVEARVDMYQRRTVWFAADEFDITSDVIKFMMTPLPDRNSPERAGAQPSGEVPAGSNSGGSKAPASAGLGTKKER